MHGPYELPSFSVQDRGNEKKECDVKSVKNLPWNTLFSKAQFSDWISLAKRVNNMPMF